MNSRIERVCSAVLWLAPALYALLALVQTPPEPILFPDSPGYLEFSALRTAGYPIFLKGVTALFGDVSPVPAIQVLTFAWSAWFFGISVRRLTGRSWSAALILLGTLGNPFLVEYHHAILTDSLFTTLALVILALLIRTVKDGRLSRLAWCGLVVGLMIALRPVGYAWAAFALFFLLVLGRKLGMSKNVLQVGGKFLVPILLCVVAESITYHQFHESRSTLFPHFVFAKGALVEGCAAGSCDHPLDEESLKVNAFIESDLAPVRAFIAGLETTDLVNSFLAPYEVFIQFTYVRIFAKRSGLPPLSPHVMMQVGRKRLLENPGGYLRLAWYHYVSMWHFFTTSHPALVDEVNAVTQGNPPPPFSEFFAEFSKPFLPNPLGWVGRPIVQFLALTTLLFALGALRLLVRPVVPPRMEAAMYAGLIVHGYFLLVALANIGSVRYVYPVWGYMIFTTGVAGLWALDFLKARLAEWRLRD